MSYCIQNPTGTVREGGTIQEECALQIHGDESIEQQNRFEEFLVEEGTINRQRYLVLSHCRDVVGL